ncbi:dynein regulatory complex protein 10 [Cylas formicarius]|uniref:dynein regulatory complex protein 10 n=1 Tax=Cylas formicarius TaxID=197179 RepID=UPI0029585BAA|nr:dynein regulatory complex protein 10 [Cylas formicarius]
METFYRKPPKPFNSVLERGDKVDNFADINIEKPPNVSPVDMELRIRADRAIGALNRTISVLNVMAHLPLLLENDGDIIRKSMPTSERNFIFHVLQEYGCDVGSNVNADPQSFGRIIESITKIKKATTSSKTSQSNKIAHYSPDPMLGQAIDLIVDNKCIRDAIRTSKKPKRNPTISEFVKSLEELREVAKLKLYVTGTEEEARDRQLRQAYKSNVLLAAAINDMKNQIEIQRKHLGKELSDKIATFEKYNQKIESIKEEFRINIEKTLHESEKTMMQQCYESEEKQIHLAEEVKKLTEEYDRLLEDHLLDEKVLRSNRLKTETQLHNWLAKYDQDIGEKQAEYDKLITEYEQQKVALEQLEDEIDEQESEYVALMQEKKEEEERIYNEMAYKLLVNRCARIIQRAWREYRERKAKRKGKKGKKSKDRKKITARK